MYGFAVPAQSREAKRQNSSTSAPHTSKPNSPNSRKANLAAAFPLSITEFGVKHMIIDTLCGRETDSRVGLALSLLFFAVGTFVARFFANIGRRRTERKAETSTSPFFPHSVGGWLIAAWDYAFALLTGAVRLPRRERNGNGKSTALRCAFAQIRFLIYATLASAVLYFAAQLLGFLTEFDTAVSLALFAQIGAACLSAAIFSLLPLPGSALGHAVEASVSEEKSTRFANAYSVGFFVFVLVSVIAARAGVTQIATGLITALLGN